MHIDVFCKINPQTWYEQAEARLEKSYCLTRLASQLGTRPRDPIVIHHFLRYTCSSILLSVYLWNNLSPRLIMTLLTYSLDIFHACLIFRPWVSPLRQSYHFYPNLCQLRFLISVGHQSIISVSCVTHRTLSIKLPLQRWLFALSFRPFRQEYAVVGLLVRRDRKFRLQFSP